MFLLPGVMCALMLTGCAGGDQNTASDAAASALLAHNAETAQSASATGAQGTEDAGNADAAQSASAAGEDGGAEEENPNVSRLSAEITLTLGDVPETLADKRAWEDVLAGFHEMYPGVTLHIQSSDAESPAPGLLLARPEQLLPGGRAGGTDSDGGAGRAWCDLTALYTPDAFSALLPNAVNACLADDGHYYAYPFAVRVSCMAINRRIFEETGALQYIDEETRSWTTENFLAAVQLLYDAGYETVLELPCAEEDPADATRSFVLNLFGGSFAKPAYTGYEVRSVNNIETFEVLKEQQGIVIAQAKTEADARASFREGSVPVVTSWDVETQLTALTNRNTELLAVSFPTNGGAVQLPGDLYCLALTAGLDAAQTEACEALLSYLTTLPFPAKDALLQSGYFPALRNLRGLYEEADDSAALFALHMVPRFGFYDRFAPEYAEACAAWNRMMAQLPNGTDVEQLLKNFQNR